MKIARQESETGSGNPEQAYDSPGLVWGNGCAVSRPSNFEQYGLALPADSKLAGVRPHLPLKPRRGSVLPDGKR
jgi:hypothetical protein